MNYYSYHIAPASYGLHLSPTGQPPLLLPPLCLVRWIRTSPPLPIMSLLPRILRVISSVSLNLGLITTLAASSPLGGLAQILLLALLIMMVSLLSTPNVVAAAVVADAVAAAGEIGQSACTAWRALRARAGIASFCDLVRSEN